jgi:hypothetical protein
MVSHDLAFLIRQYPIVFLYRSLELLTGVLELSDFWSQGRFHVFQSVRRSGSDFMDISYHFRRCRTRQPKNYDDALGDCVGALGCERRRDCHSSAQVMRYASPAPATTSNTAIFASIGAPPIPTSSFAIDYQSKQPEPDWGIPERTHSSKESFSTVESKRGIAAALLFTRDQFTCDCKHSWINRSHAFVGRRGGT